MGRHHGFLSHRHASHCSAGAYFPATHCQWINQRRSQRLMPQSVSSGDPNNMATKIVLVGAGSAQFGYGTLGDIFQSTALYGSEIVLHDINPASLAVTEKTARDFLAKEDLPFIVSATTDRATALRGAGFVIISIEVGDRFALWDLDWQIPQQYGI